MVSSDAKFSFWRRREVVVILALAFVVRMGVLWAWQEKLEYDPDAYRLFAKTWVETCVYAPGAPLQPSAYRPPLYPLLLTISVVSPLGFVGTTALLHLLLGVGTVALVLRLAERAEVNLWIAGILTACDPILLNQSALVMTETLAAFLAALALWLMTRAGDAPTPGRFAQAGAALALAALCRPTFLLVLGAAGIALVWKCARGRRLACGGALVAAVAVCLAPWVLRNQLALGKPILATTHGGYTLHLANNPAFYAYLRQSKADSEAEFGPGVDPAKYLEERIVVGTLRVPDARQRRAGGVSPLTSETDSSPASKIASALRVPDGKLEGTAHGVCRLRDELAWDQAHYAAAVQAIQEAPAMFLWASVVRVGRLWQLVPHAESAERESPSMRRLRYLVGVWYGGVFGLAAVGMWRRRKDLAQSPWIWCLILAACFTALHAVYWTNMRMRAPLMPAVALVAAAGWGKSGKPKAESGENGARNQPEGGGA